MALLLVSLIAFGPQVLVVSGQNNHDGERTTAHLVAILGEDDHFEVTVANTPARGGDWQDFQPDFAAYDVVVLAYNGEMWPEPVQEAFEDYIEGGGTALVQHAANNPFRGWEAFERMVGLLWRSPEAGYRVYMEEDGSLVREEPGEGIGAGHGRLHDWHIATRDAAHPVMRDLPAVWLHPHDELYHGQRGPAEDMRILATSYSDPEHGGTGKHELMIWWIPYGEGKVLTMLPGHLWSGQEDERAFRCVGFRTMLTRSVQWLATGSVTMPVPEDFPTADAISVRPE